ncbi:flagellar motor switch protein FliM [Sphingomonas sp. R-74633]|uniref:flagellar motor switch protein FliM n=1 Tax=Sphingomonas sp. R-74633 TaxID=2751188 RepID=UPI0015D443CD|nr:flagellar motor switch protein FliM [Sphingomonas sp. R-74633]NYT42127.1 flagellar motor switch protein FliM [Sphingomonas sp. R-74633]
MIDLEDFDLPDPPAAIDLGGAANFDQADIDALFGDFGPTVGKKGLRAVIESKVISHERLPMLEVVCDRVVRSFASSMRNLTSDGVDVSLEEVTSTRFGEFMNRVALPAMVGVFKIEEWESYGLVTVDSSLIYSVVDALLGGRGGGGSTMVIDGRAFTTIETGLVSRMLSLALSDFSEAFEPIEPVTMNLERIETNPRFAAIAGVSNICATATFRVDMDGRGGRFTLVFPYATLEPVRDKLLQRFMGEKSGRDSIWEAHMAAEVRKTNVSMSVLLGEKPMSIAELQSLEVGQTIALHKSPDDPLDIACGGVKLAQGQIGQRSGKVAVRLVNDVSSDKKVKQ